MLPKPKVYMANSSVGLWSPPVEGRRNESCRSLQTSSCPDSGLALSLQKPCHLFVSVDKATLFGALAQDYEGRKVDSRRPVCKTVLRIPRMHFISSGHHPPHWGEPQVNNLFGCLTVSTLHQVRVIWQQKARRRLTGSNAPKNETILEKSGLIAGTDNCLNPAEFLTKRNPLIPTEHYCLDLVELKWDLLWAKRDPFPQRPTLFIGGPPM